MIIDVREKEEWDEGHIETATHIALSKLVNDYALQINKNCNIILYCQKGQRSVQAAKILKSQGYENIKSMSGGYESWLKI